MASTTVMLLTGVNSVSSAASSYQQAGAVMAKGEYTRRLYEWNASLAKREAEEAKLRGRQAESKLRTDSALLLGEQRAGLAAQGIDIATGTAATIQEETLGMSALDLLTIQNNTAREALGYEVQASDLRAQGEFAELDARNQAGALRAQSFGTLLTGASQIAGLYAERDRKTSKKSSSIPEGKYITNRRGDRG